VPQAVHRCDEAVPWGSKLQGKSKPHAA
jgi:hypothetical protein